MASATTVSELTPAMSLMQRAALETLGEQAIYLSAGSAISFLDSIFFGTAMTMTDLDININARTCTTEAEYYSALMSLARAANLRVTPDTFRDMRRVVRHADGSDTPLFIAGYRIFARHSDTSVPIDLSLFSDMAPLMQNGYLNTQLVKVTIPINESLETVAKTVRELGYERALREKIVIDEHGGYAAWQNTRHEVVYPAQIAADPIRVGVRIIREYAAWGQSLTPDLLQLIRANIERVPFEVSDVRVLRNLSRLVLDTAGADKHIAHLKTTGILSRLDNEPATLIAMFIEFADDPLRETAWQNLQRLWRERVLSALVGH